MYIRFSALLPVAALAAVVVAAPSELQARNDGTSECNTGNNQCCNNVVAQNDPTVTSLLGIFGVLLPDVAGQVAYSCSPITVIGVGTGASCSQQAVCCNGNTFNGLINFGCSPVNINL